ncbi:MAG: hypothetical protein Q7N87_03545 [Candidatus Uhrbacteria bacterium]|nr:hypothetical protein [Candidatus Uhrbacteria bacterium]
MINSNLLMSVILAGATLLAVLGVGCKQSAPLSEPYTPFHDVEGDRLGSDRVGDESFEIKSPDNTWRAYRIKIDDDPSYALIVEGPNGLRKELARTSTHWPESFSPDGQLLLFVKSTHITDARATPSLFVYEIATGKIKQLTNTDPKLVSLNNDDYYKRFLYPPTTGVEWDGRTFTYVDRADDGKDEVIRINAETGEIVRSGTKQ